MLLEFLQIPLKLPLGLLKLLLLYEFDSLFVNLPLLLHLSVHELVPTYWTSFSTYLRLGRLGRRFLGNC